MKAAPTIALRPALHLALVVARQGESASPPSPCPPRLRPFLTFAKAPATALELCRRAVEEDDVFRSRVAAATTVEEVGAIGWLWLTRPEGWEATAAELHAQQERELLQARVARGQDELERRQQAAEGAAAQAEQARRVAVAAMERAQAEAADARRRQRELTAERDQALHSLGAADDERRQLLRQLKAAEAVAATRTREVAELRARLTDVAQTTAASPYPDAAPEPHPATAQPGPGSTPNQSVPASPQAAPNLHQDHRGAASDRHGRPGGADLAASTGRSHPGSVSGGDRGPEAPGPAVLAGQDAPGSPSNRQGRLDAPDPAAVARQDGPGSPPNRQGRPAAPGSADDARQDSPASAADGKRRLGGPDSAAVAGQDLPGSVAGPEDTAGRRASGPGRSPDRADPLRQAVHAASVAAQALALALSDAARALDTDGTPTPTSAPPTSDPSAGPVRSGSPLSVNPALSMDPARPMDPALPKGSAAAPASRSASVGRRRPLRMPPGTFEDGQQAAWHLSRVPNVVLLIDGYNVSKLAWPALELAHQRERLIDALVTLQARTGARAEVVFDGIDEGNTPARHAPERLHVEFTAADREADDRLLELVDTTPLHRPVVVVSTDRRVRDGARQRGANTLTAAQLLSLLR
ncbi:MAG: NYN domain-containing protein [Acidimicrobiales bacterium]